MAKKKKATRIATPTEMVVAQPLGVPPKASVIPLVRVTRYMAVAGDQPLVVIQAAHRGAAEQALDRLRAPAHAATHLAVEVMPVSKAPAALRKAMAEALSYAWHPAACPGCLRVWRSPAWAIDTCPACLGVAGVEGVLGLEDADD
jgi:hypothetical protein